jgi:hypothetical protein
MKRGARPLVLCLTLLTTTATSLLALGQGPPRDEEALIKRGLELREKGDDEAALREFRRAHELSRSGRALAQVALAEQALGRWVDAESHLIEAVRHEQEPWVARNLRLLRQALTDIQSHLGSLELSGGAAGAEVRINGAPAGTLPMASALRVPAGTVALEVRAPNHLPMLRTVIVPAGGLAREPLVLVPILSSAEAPPARPPAHVDSPPPPDSGPASATIATPAAGGWSTRRKLGAGLVAGGVASLAVGIIFHVIRNGRAADFNDAGCTFGNGNVAGPPAAACSSRYDDIQGARNLAIGGYGGAVILGGVGGFLWLTGGATAVRF